MTLKSLPEGVLIPYNLSESSQVLTALPESAQRIKYHNKAVVPLIDTVYECTYTKWYMTKSLCMISLISPVERFFRPYNLSNSSH